MTSFWKSQLKTLWGNLGELPPIERVRAFFESSREMWRRHVSITASPMVGTGVDDGEKLTVILLNHKRPENIGHIARYMLRAGFVGKLIVSNNSQAYPIESYVTVEDTRLVLINQDKPSGVGIRFELARRYPARYYLCVDDDIFLHPTQLQWIYSNLRRSADRPHGIFGAAYTPDANPEKEWPFVHRRNSDCAVEILNGLFAFTDAHLDEFYRLCGILGISDPKSLMNGEDIVLSFSGDRRPFIHNIGPIWECASASSPGVALHVTRPRFYEERWRIYSELSRMKPLMKEAS